MSKVGIMGGTFNPIHLAHTEMAKVCLRQQDLDKILFMPSKNPPHKKDKSILPENERAVMVKLAVSEYDKFVFSDFELQRKGTTYTADTLRLLQEENPDDNYYFIMGADSLLYLDKWYRPQEILKRAVILAIGRDGSTPDELKEKRKELIKQYDKADIRFVHMRQMDISSSMIREGIAHGENMEKYLDKEVWNYINENGLYDAI
ncbi:MULTISPECIES: nicotinate-nucleotide adenylyltransferase [Clostridia]|jgi:nicotinate-nucleotide adenylyltransferase|uniref:nicotinate-nucleotide adenylyltransferase n=1 Tax=Clostridia TaxID=186801 RepID=UPI000E503E9C|nr:nicotinate-nucleotide adenylyltransferase [Clostridium sp. AF34-13]RHP27398.1 nicotinate (nicotinamide) nucleotide adenylyltransferase [Clostridium sp. AF34-13]